MMLRTSVKDLIDLHKKEELELKFCENIEEIRDHLPFNKLIYKIAAGMKTAPKRPKFKILIEKE